MDKILESIVSWAKTQPEIKSLILTSSRAGASQTDEFSDYDIMVISDDFQQYLASDEWIKAIKPIWVYQKESFNYDQILIPTRLVIFEGNTKVDFSFWPSALLKSFIHKLSEDMDRGYVVLLDKTGITADLPQPTKQSFKEKKPDKDTFLKLIYDFWFEVLGVAKYLKRNDVYFAKKIDNGIVKDILLKMIIWNLQTKNNWTVKTHAEGKKMKTWLDEATIERLAKIHSGFDLSESWQSLFETISLFRQLAQETSEKLQFSYPHTTDKNISDYINSLRFDKHT